MRVLKVWYVAALASGMTALYIYFSGVSNSDDLYELSRTDKGALAALQIGFSKCVNHNGLGLEAVTAKDFCRVTLKYPSGTVSSWRDAKTGDIEGLSFDFNLCEAVATWEQVRNSTTILTKEYIDALPNGWHEYAWRRINKGTLLNNCRNKTLCMEKLKLVLPETAPYVPRQFGRCAVVGNSGDLLKTNFGEEIDKFDVVIRENGAPIQNYTKHVGRKSTFRILNRGSAKALDKVVELDESRKEVLIVKTTIHDIMNKMIQEIPIKNPVYLMLGTSFGSSAKGTGLKALEFALSMCDSVDMYGFTVDPGYKEWTRYFSESRGGHTPLLGRAYYQMMECLGLVKIHSPMRANPNRVLRWLPSQRIINAARVASEKMLQRVGAGMEGPLCACSIIRRREKAMEKRENMVQSGLREAAIRHQEYTEGATLYPMEKHPGHGMGQENSSYLEIFRLDPLLVTSHFSTTDSSVYDEKKCLKDYNNFSMYHNNNYYEENLRKSNPDVTIIYADYYEAFMHMLDQASSLGFEEDSLLMACCGTGGGYNYESNLMRGSPGTTQTNTSAGTVSI